MSDKSWKQGERQVAEKLGELWGIKFYRSEGSGAVATSRINSLPKSVVYALTGDVIHDPKDESLHPDMGFPFVNEVKTRHVPKTNKSKEDAIDLFDVCRRGRESNIGQWWDQVSRDACRVSKLPLLWMKTVGRRWYIGIDTSFVDQLTKEEIDADVPLSERTINFVVEMKFAVTDKVPTRVSIMEASRFIELGRKRIEDICSKIKLPMYNWDVHSKKELK